MIILMTAMLLAATMAWGYAKYRLETAPARARHGRLHTFLIDPPTMLIVGLASAILGLMTRKGRKLTMEQFKKRRRVVSGFLLLFLAGFWTMELLTYFDVMGHPWNPSKTGNDFMVNGYIEWLTGPISSGPFPIYHEWWSWPLLLGMLALQAAVLWFGSALGYQAAYFNEEDRWSRPKAK